MDNPPPALPATTVQPVASTDSAQAAPPAAPLGPLFQCGTCKKKYKRVDHLARHVRSHTQSKPYPCRICSKSFGRADLLKRHVAAHDVQDRRDNPGAQSRRASAGPGRVSTACKTCASCHLRCSEEKPCRRCVDRGLDCIWTTPSGAGDETDSHEQSPAPATPPHQQQQQQQPLHQRHAGQMDVASAIANSPPQPVMAHEHQQQQQQQHMMDPRSSMIPPTPRHDVPNHHSTMSDGMAWQRLPPPPPPPPMPQPIDQGPPMHDSSYHHHDSSADASAMGLMGNPYFPAGFLDMGHASGTWTPMGAAHMSMGGSMDLDDIDLHFLNSYNTNLPFEIASDSGTNHTPQAPPDYPTVNSGSLDTSHSNSRLPSSNAFRNSYWKFQPNAADHAGAEEHNLSLPTDKDGHTTAAAPKIALSKRVTGAPLCINARDKILSLVVDNCRPENLSRAVASFPSIELLDTLIQFYLTSAVVRADSFIHVASFNPNDKKAELLASMAAAGAHLTSDPALTKLGSAIQECVRRAVPKHWERDNSTTRDLELSLAWIISLETAIWSGHSRKVEIAESFMQPLLTMIRRNAKFRPSGYTEVKLWRDDDGHTLDQKWKEWATQESFKRLAFRMFQHDTDSSLALMINPLVSYAEVLVDLPCAHDIWAAPTKERWKQAFLVVQPTSSPAAQSPTLADCLDNPTWHLPTDPITASLAYLSVVWRLAWEYLQLASMQKKSKPQRWNSYLLFSRHEELVKLLSRFRLSMDDVPASVSNSQVMMLIMRAEHISLHIHAPFEDILRFAGMEGPDQARLAHEGVVEWMRTETSRKAVWHAGQILRSARLMHRSRVQGPLAVIVFHASLVLWVYGLMYVEMNSRGGLTAGNNNNNNNNNNNGNPANSQGDMNMYGTPASQQTPQISEDLNLRPLVLVDDDESGAVQRFIQFDRGAPCIQKRISDFSDANTAGGAGHANGPPMQHTSLFEPDGVMEAIIDILAQNHPPKSRPPLVENLIQVLSELARSSPPSASRSEQR